MNSKKKNRQFILEYYQEISGARKTREMMELFTADSKLIDHMLFFERLFPRYEIRLDQITSEGDRVIVRGRNRGRRPDEMPSTTTNKIIEVPFAIGYRIEQQKIVDHWLITDQMELLDQLGLITIAE